MPAAALQRAAVRLLPATTGASAQEPGQACPGAQIRGQKCARSSAKMVRKLSGTADGKLRKVVRMAAQSPPSKAARYLGRLDDTATFNNVIISPKPTWPAGKQVGAWAWCMFGGQRTDFGRVCDLSRWGG